MTQNPTNYTGVEAKPSTVMAIAVMTLINGILNIFVALGLTVTVVFGSFGLGILCAPLTILPLVLGIFEILYASNLLPETPQPVKPSQTIAVLEICCVFWGNLISLVVGIVALVFYAQPEVKNYFARINA